MNRVLVCGLFAGIVGGMLSSRAVEGQPHPREHPTASVRPIILPVPVGTVYSTSCYPSHASQALVVNDPRPLVWVIDGAGDLKGCSSALAQSRLGNTLDVELTVFPWSHGYRRLYKDQTDWNHARMQGARLAAAIRDRRAREPNRRVVVVAHSAGCAVALTAAEVLPPDTIDRMILLAPSVSSGYDIRPALWSAREGVDVFCSKKDWIALGFVTRVVGTVDRLRTRAAGRHGFQTGDSITDLEARRLRQHFWTPEIAWTGHTGGHHGMYAPTFLRVYIHPLLDVRR